MEKLSKLWENSKQNVFVGNSPRRWPIAQRVDCTWCPGKCSFDQRFGWKWRIAGCSECETVPRALRNGRVSEAVNVCHGSDSRQGQCDYRRFQEQSLVRSRYELFGQWRVSEAGGHFSGLGCELLFTFVRFQVDEKFFCHPFRWIILCSTQEQIDRVAELNLLTDNDVILAIRDPDLGRIQLKSREINILG